MQLIVTPYSCEPIGTFSDEPECVLVCERGTMPPNVRRLVSSGLGEWLSEYTLGRLWGKGARGKSFKADDHGTRDRIEFLSTGGRSIADHRKGLRSILGGTSILLLDSDEDPTRKQQCRRLFEVLKRPPQRTGLKRVRNILRLSYNQWYWPGAHTLWRLHHASSGLSF